MLDETVTATPAPPVDAIETGSPGAIAPALIPALLVAACGTDVATPGPAPTPLTSGPPPVAPPTAQQAGRFLAQAAMGSTKTDLEQVQTRGYEGWLTDQFAVPRATSHWDWMIAAGYAAPANIDGLAGFDPSVWRQLITGQDQLRQRVGMALLDMLVVGIDGLSGNWKAFAGAAYLDILMDNAFGNYRTLLERISTNAAMGSYLTFAGNRKADPRAGSLPDENYARELMQLFTLGVNQLNGDGTVKMAGNKPLETYTQDDVSGLARVFTGWNVDGADSATPDRLRRPMVQQAGRHELGVKSFLGTTIPAGSDGPTSLGLALDAIFAHPNVAPFVGKQLIQRLVTSNPSPGYVTRVAAAFANNGSGVRGDMRAIIRAILLDSEARDASLATGASYGKLRAPVVRLTNWARAFNARSPSDTWPIGDTSNPSYRLAQSPGHSPSVFNFFRPGYAPPNTGIASQGLVAPEFQITSELSVVGYINFMQTLIASGIGDLKADYADLLTLAGDAKALVDQVNLLVAGGAVSAASVTAIQGAVETIPATAANASTTRAHIAILLIMASPEYIVQK